MSAMNLGELIDTLAGLPPDEEIMLAGISAQLRFASWRGRYEELTLVVDDTPGTAPMTIGELLAEALKADGGVFYGYKGGDYTMSRSTPVWADGWGDCYGVCPTGVMKVGGRWVIMVDQRDPY